MKLEVYVDDNQEEKVIETIKNAAYSGKIGDGKIFVLPMDECVRIRTGERGSDAI